MAEADQKEEPKNEEEYKETTNVTPVSLFRKQNYSIIFLLSFRKIS